MCDSRNLSPTAARRRNVALPHEGSEDRHRQTVRGREPVRAAAARGQDRERGASTLEIVFWAVGLLALAGIVYAAINAYIQGKLPGISG